MSEEQKRAEAVEDENCGRGAVTVTTGERVEGAISPEQTQDMEAVLEGFGDE